MRGRSGNWPFYLDSLYLYLLVQLITDRCTELESGGRMIDAILTNTVLPTISEELLKRMVEAKPIERVHVGVEGGEFCYGFE